MKIETVYQPLPLKFRQGGFNFQQLMRQGDVILLQKGAGSYEVVIVQKEPEREVFGKKYPAEEKMPRSEQWGAFGWTPYDLPRAIKKFHWAVAKTKASQLPREIFAPDQLAELTAKSV